MAETDNPATRTTSPAEPHESARLSSLDRLLRPFSDVRAGESGTVLILFLNLFLLLVGYYILKTVREPLILATGGAEMKAYASAAQALLLVGFIPLYSWFASRVDRMKLIVGLTLFFILNIELFFLGGLAQVKNLGIVFFVWLGVFNMSTPAQFWAFANDLYRRDAGERLFPIIAIGATLGSPLGAQIATALFDRGVDPYKMMHISVALLVLHLGLYLVVNRRETHRPRQAAVAESPLAGARGGFGLVFASPYIRLIALLLVLANLVNTTGEYILSRSVVDAAEAAIAADPSLNKGAFIGSFYGRYFFWVNILTLLIQALLVSRIVKYAGLAGAILALPLVALGAYSLIFAGAGFAAIRWAKTAENSTDYSVMNTAKQMLWLPTRREEKYKAKQATDTFFVRAGDVLSALIVFAGNFWLGLGIGGFALSSLVLIALWLVVAALLLGEHRRLTARQQALAPEDTAA